MKFWYFKSQAITSGRSLAGLSAVSHSCVWFGVGIPLQNKCNVTAHFICSDLFIWRSYFLPSQNICFAQKRSHQCCSVQTSTTLSPVTTAHHSSGWVMGRGGWWGWVRPLFALCTPARTPSFSCTAPAAAATGLFWTEAPLSSGRCWRGRWVGERGREGEKGRES